MSTETYIHQFPNGARATLTITFDDQKAVKELRCRWHEHVTPKAFKAISAEYRAWRDASVLDACAKHGVGKILIVEP